MIAECHLRKWRAQAARADDNRTICLIDEIDRLKRALDRATDALILALEDERTPLRLEDGL